MKHEIINDINLTIRTLVENELKSVFKNVTVRVSDLESLKKGGSKTGVNIFLYAATINEPGIRTRQPQEQRQEIGDEIVYKFYPPPVPLTLSFMFTPFTTDPATELRLIGRIIQIFQENPLLTGDALRGDWLPQLNELGIQPDFGFSVERQLEVFRSFDMPLKLSVGYLVRATLHSDKVVRTSKAARDIRRDAKPSEPMEKKKPGFMDEPRKAPKPG